MRRSELLAAEAVSCLNKALSRLKDIWEEIGIPEEQRLQRTNMVKSHIKNLLEMMIEEEEALRKRLMHSIHKCKAEMQRLCLELQLPVFQEEEGLSILQQEKNIRTEVEALMKEKGQRMQQLQDLLHQEQDLCDILVCKPYGLTSDSIPTREQLESFRQYIALQNAEKAQRHAEFRELKKEIILCMEELDHIPETSFEKDVVYEDEDSFCLSRDNATSLRLLLHQLQERRVEQEGKCEAHREKIQQMWELLQVSTEDREALSKHMVTSKRRNLEALQAELRRLEELKLRNICSVTDALRSEILELWEKCFYSSEQRQDFTAFYSVDFDDDLLAVHEAELHRLKQYYEKHQELFSGVHRWSESWRLFQELEKKAADPSRFTNRGGNLLKEEKLRCELQKSLPKLEKKLKVQIQSWENEQGCSFLVNGQKFLQFVEEQWEQHRAQKEKEKLERHSKKSQQLEEDMLYGTTIRSPVKHRFLGQTPPNKSKKLINATSSTSSATCNSTLRSLYTATGCRSPVPSPTLSARKALGGLKPPRFGDCNKENKGLPNGTPPSTQRNFSMASIASTYSEFVDLKSSEPLKSSETCPWHLNPRSSTES
ncbi:protein regulator of cytokinesis 1b isoform X2 [Oryzias melastigma]|uniref:protein regulator of cytokinesis 1b isoform X2 n=1 Tax=Oryzias melastigma TaxID=30732 RepID=UPI000CF82645|nr:protein regulator of cytokinesis 1b isoform X2 [Oryzias melastigma]